MPLDVNAPCTICIPTYNQAEHLRTAVLSVIAQTAPVRLIVADDASPDHTPEVLAELQRQHSFRYHRHVSNLGIGPNIQWLLRAAETPFIVRLDSDDLLHPDYVAALLPQLQQHARAAYAHCAIQEIDGTGRPTRLRTLARKQGFQDADTALRRAVGGYQVAANILLFRREALASVNFGAGLAAVNFVEDYDLSVRLADANWGNVYVPEVLASYRAWDAPSRPHIGRKLASIQGITHVFAHSLSDGFRLRGWPMRTLVQRRQQLAIANAEILDRGLFSRQQREEMVGALLQLSDMPLVRVAVGDGWMGRLLRRAVSLAAQLQQGAKARLKRVLFRR